MRGVIERIEQAQPILWRERLAPEQPRGGLEHLALAAAKNLGQVKAQHPLLEPLGPIHEHHLRGIREQHEPGRLRHGKDVLPDDLLHTQRAPLREFGVLVLPLHAIDPVELVRRERGVQDIDARLGRVVHREAPHVRRAVSLGDGSERWQGHLPHRKKRRLHIIPERCEQLRGDLLKGGRLLLLLTLTARRQEVAHLEEALPQVAQRAVGWLEPWILLLRALAPLREHLAVELIPHHRAQVMLGVVLVHVLDADVIHALLYL